MPYSLTHMRSPTLTGSQHNEQSMSQSQSQRGPGFFPAALRQQERNTNARMVPEQLCRGVGEVPYLSLWFGHREDPCLPLAGGKPESDKSCVPRRALRLLGGGSISAPVYICSSISHFLSPRRDLQPFGTLFSFPPFSLHNNPVKNDCVRCDMQKGRRQRETGTGNQTGT